MVSLPFSLLSLLQSNLVLSLLDLECFGFWYMYNVYILLCLLSLLCVLPLITDDYLISMRKYVIEPNGTYYTLHTNRPIYWQIDVKNTPIRCLSSLKSSVGGTLLCSRCSFYYDSLIHLWVVFFFCVAWQTEITLMILKANMMKLSHNQNTHTTDTLTLPDRCYL